MTCAYCNVYARHPCKTRSEASQCGNNDDPGSYMDFDVKDVVTWIKSRAWDDTELWAAANLIEERM